MDKTLLEKPEHEIDPKQISIKDLILLAEAKEKISVSLHVYYGYIMRLIFA